MTASKYHQKFPHSQHTTALLTPSNTLKLSLQGGGGGNANIYPSLDAFRWADNASNLRKMWHNGILLHLYKTLAWHFQFHSNFVLCLENASFVDSNDSAKIIMLAMYCCSLSLHRLLSSCWTHERLSDCYELIHVSKIFLFFILFYSYSSAAIKVTATPIFQLVYWNDSCVTVAGTWKGSWKYWIGSF